MKKIIINYKIILIFISIITISVATFINLASNPDLTEKQAIMELFGNYNDTQKNAIWKDMKIPDSEENSYFSEKAGITSTIFFQSFREAGKKKIFLITKTIPVDIPFECHACNPLLSAAIFAKSNGSWKIEAKNLFVMYEGEYGSSPKAELIRIGNDKFAARIEYEHRFDMLLETEIALLIPYKDYIEKAYQQVIYFDNFSGCGWGHQCAAYKTEIDLDKSTKDDFYKIKVTRFGTENDKEQDNRAVPVEEKLVYQYTNGKYQQISWNGHPKINYKKLDNDDDND